MFGPGGGDGESPPGPEEGRGRCPYQYRRTPVVLEDVATDLAFGGPDRQTRHVTAGKSIDEIALALALRGDQGERGGSDDQRGDQRPHRAPPPSDRGMRVRGPRRGVTATPT